MFPREPLGVLFYYLNQATAVDDGDNDPPDQAGWDKTTTTTSPRTRP